MAGRGYVLALLALLSASNQLDRQLTAILLEPIRAEFALSDVQLGLLSGLAFAVLYAGLSIPAAIWAVRHSRRNLVALSAAVWGAMTLVSGLAQSFAQLLVGRIGLGLGEAGAMPASHAMISDLYARDERGFAMSVWSAGVNVGIFVAFLVGGVIGHRFGWRVAFITSGIITVVLALLVRFTASEPARMLDRERDLRKAPSLGLIWMTLRLLWGDAALRNIAAGSVLTATVGYGTLAWLPSFLVRVHHLNIAQAGAYLALVIGLGGGAVAAAGGKLFDVLHRRDARWSMAFVGLVYIAIKPLLLTFFLAGSTRVALAAYIIPGLVGTIYIGPTLAVLHNRVTASLRPTASAVFLMLVNLIGLSLGPLLVGAMSEWLFAASGNALGYSLAMMQVFGVWGAVHFIIAGRRLVQSAPAARAA